MSTPNRKNSLDGEAIFRELGDVVTEAMERLKVPGVAVGVIYDGQEYTKGFGVTNIHHPLPVNDQSLFQIGSTTKTFTGTVAMRLVEMGKLNLDTPINQYLKGKLSLRDQSTANNVTLRHLFNHTAGWEGDFFQDTGSGDDAVARYVEAMSELDQLTSPGSVWSYNNAGFSLAGRVIEVVTGQTYEEAVKELLLKPLGLDHTFFFASDAIVHGVAVGHLVNEGKPTEIALPWALPRSAHPAGGIISNVKDQLRYARFHMGDGSVPNPGTTQSKTEDANKVTRLLNPETISYMQSPLVSAGVMHEAVGITWLLDRQGDVITVGHGGATNGQLSAFRMVPSEQFAITILTNANVGVILHREVVKWALERYLGAKEPEHNYLTLTAAELASYTGSYTTRSNDIDLKIGEPDKNGNAPYLIMQVTPKPNFPTKDSPAPPAPPPVRLAFTKPDVVVALDAPYKDVEADFLRNSTNNTVEWFRISGRILKRVS